MSFDYKIFLVLSIVVWAVVLGIIISTKTRGVNEALWELAAQEADRTKAQESRLERHL